MLTPTQIWRKGWQPLPLTSRGTPGIPWRHLFDKRDPDTWARERRAGWTKWGVVTGPSSGLIVLDCDTWLAVARAERRGIPETFTVKTARGKHFYFECPDVSPPTFKIWPDADLKGHKGMVKLIDGEKTILKDCDLAEPPRWLLREIAFHMAKKNAQEVRLLKQIATAQTSPEKAHRYLKMKLRALARAPDGRRNIYLNAITSDLSVFIHNGSLPAEMVIESLTEVALSIGLTERETERTIKSALRG